MVEPDAMVEPEAPALLVPTDVGVRVGEAALLAPLVKIDGELRGGLECTASAGAYACEADELGVVRAVLEGEQILRAEFEANEDVLVEALYLGGRMKLDDATTWLSNGFQSWSQSGAIAIGPTPAAGALEEALHAEGDEEALREGSELSWQYTWVGGGSEALVAGALTADRLAPWVSVFDDEDSGERALLLGAGDTGEAIAVAAGEVLQGERWHLGAGEELHLLLHDYADALPSRRDTVETSPYAGWMSWYELFAAVTEADVRANAERLETEVAPALPEGTGRPVVFVDDGWQEAWGQWTPGEDFPSGLDGLAADLEQRDLDLGVWLAPLLVHEDAPLAAEHPEWLVQDRTWSHIVEGTMHILDPSHPGAAAHLEATMAQLVTWGVDVIKVDFLFVGTFEGARHQELTGAQAYHLALEAIRSGASDATLLGVAGPAVPTLAYVDAWRVGGDISVEPRGPRFPFVANQARSLAARWPFCIRTLCDPDPVVVRPPLSDEEAGAAAWVVALAGGGWVLSDDLTTLPEARWPLALDLDRAAVALSGHPATPLDLLPEEPPTLLTSALADHLQDTSSHVLPALWELPDGRVVALNVTDTPRILGGVEVAAHGAAIVGE